MVSRCFSVLVLQKQVICVMQIKENIIQFFTYRIPIPLPCATRGTLLTLSQYNNSYILSALNRHFIYGVIILGKVPTLLEKSPHCGFLQVKG